MSTWRSVRLLDGIRTLEAAERFSTQEFEAAVHEDLNDRMSLDLVRIISVVDGLKDLLRAGEHLGRRFSFFGAVDSRVELLKEICRHNTVSIAAQVLEQLLPHVREAVAEGGPAAAQWARVQPEFEMLASRPEALRQYDLGRLREVSAPPSSEPQTSALALSTGTSAPSEPAMEDSPKPESRWSRLDVE